MSWIALGLVGTESHLPGQIGSDRESHATAMQCQWHRTGTWGKGKTKVACLPCQLPTTPVRAVDGQMWSLAKWRAAAAARAGSKVQTRETNNGRQRQKQARHFLTAESFSPRSCCCCKLEKMRGWIDWYAARQQNPRKQINKNNKNRLPDLPPQRESGV